MRLLHIIILVGVIILSLSLAIYTAGSDKQHYIVELGDQSIEGEFYDAIVLFRNDDVKTMNEDFEEVNQVFIDNNIPVSHGIVPEWFIERNDDFDSACKDFRELKENNPDLIEYSAHGWDHKGYEFSSTDWIEISNKVENTTNFFDECLEEEAEVFIPPQNALSTSSRLILEENGFKVISGDMKSRWQNNQARITANGSEYLSSRALMLGQTSKFVEVWEPELRFNQVSDLQAEFNETIDKNRIHVQTLHYSRISSEGNIAKLVSLMDKMENENIRFSSFEEIMKLLEEDRIKSVDDGWIINEE